jgi:hypothetical protein
VTAPSEDVELSEENAIASVKVPSKMDYEVDSQEDRFYDMRQLVHVYFRLTYDSNIPMTMPDHEIIDIYNSFDDEQRANLEQYCDIDSVQLNGIKYRKYYSEHIVTPTAKSALGQSNVAPSIVPTTINFTEEPRQTLAKVVKQTLNQHHISSSDRDVPTYTTAIIKAATIDLMSPMSNERGHVFESGGHVAYGGDGGGGGGSSSSSSSSTSLSSSSSSSSESDRKKKKKKNKKSEKSVKTVPFVEGQEYNGGTLYVPKRTLDARWYLQRRAYVHSISPKKDKEREKVNKKVSKLYDIYFKRASQQKIKPLTLTLDQRTRMKHYRLWKDNLFYIFGHHSSPGQENILDEYGKIQFDATVDWYVLKATALFIQSKVDQNMRHHLHHIDKDDTIAILVKLNDVCAGVKPGIVRHTMAKLSQQRIGSNETATSFIARMCILFDDAFALDVEIQEKDKVDIVLAGMFGNEKYSSHINHFSLLRNKEELTPNRYIEDNLQLADIERTQLRRVTIIVTIILLPSRITPLIKFTLLPNLPAAAA